MTEPTAASESETTADATIERADAHYERGGGTLRAFAAAGASLATSRSNAVYEER